MIDMKKLNEALEEGEVIVWSGVPQPYSFFGESHKKSTMITLAWAIVWAIVLIGGYSVFAASKNIEIQKSIMSFCVAIPVFILGMALADKNRVKKLIYAVTDKRAIVLSEKPLAMPLAEIDDIRIDTADDGNCHIRIGSPAFKSSLRKLPVLASRGEVIEQDNEKTYTGLVFYNVSAADEKVVRNLLKPAASSARA